MTILSPRVKNGAVLNTVIKTVPRIDYAALSRKTEGSKYFPLAQSVSAPSVAFR
jgi:hypothetical protein